MSLSAHFTKAVGGFTLRVDIEEESGILGLLGASGAGKSMTLSCIAGLVAPTDGYIAVDGAVWYDSARKINLPPQKRRAGLLLQNGALFPNMTLLQNVGAGVRDAKKRDALCKRLIGLLRLDGLEQQYPAQLSGGQQQRAALARTLASEPRLLLLDEPFAALDARLAAEISQDLLPLLQGFGGNVVYVSHQLEELYQCAARLCVMHKGHMVESGDTKALFAAPKTLESARLFGCRNFLPLMQSENGIFANALCSRLAPQAANSQMCGIYESRIFAAPLGSARANATVMRKSTLPNKTILQAQLASGEQLYLTAAREAPFAAGDAIGIAFCDADFFFCKPYQAHDV